MKPLQPVHRGAKLDLRKVSTDDKGSFKDKDEARDKTRGWLERIAELQEVLYAEGKRSLLVVFQGMDTSGKDGATKSLAGAVNPGGMSVVSWKAPSKEELAHDFLWRIHKETPGKGRMTFFNRSHYEDVGIVRVHRWIDEKACRARYGFIRDFERSLAAAGTVVLKFFLHISLDEQKQRFEDRLKDPTKTWKFNPADLDERKLWPDYMKTYGEAISETSLPEAPWYVVAADRKWYRDAMVAKVVLDRLEDLELKYPAAAEGLKGLKVD